jgi:hypothetical protein
LRGKKTSKLMDIVTLIKGMAIKISQIPNFKSIIDKVIKYCLDAMKEKN